MTSIIGAHLNGSINLADAETVFRTVQRIAGASVKRVPDGETGPRQGWVQAMIPKLRASAELVEGSRDPGLNMMRDGEPMTRDLPPIFELRDRSAQTPVTFPELGYATAARESYATFASLRADGTIPARTRFQMSLPTPFAAMGFIAPRDVPVVMPALEAKLREEIEAVTAAIPHDDLAIQWDVAPEFAVIEGALPLPIDDPLGKCLGDLVRLAGYVPEDVQLGYHLCYGDIPEAPGKGEGRHFVEPRDTAILVDVANGLSSGIHRAIHWISIPVPIGRDDEAYFRPLADLTLHPETELYLGLIHHQDGLAGARRRIAAASRYVETFGVATECGMGRKPTAVIPTILEIQRDVCAQN